MKPLFTGFFCPRDCDKPEVLAKRKAALDRLNEIKAEIAKAQSLAATPRIWAGWPAMGLPVPAPPPAAPLPDDKCRDFYCGGKGKVAVSMYNGAIKQYDKYYCQTCGKDWQIDYGNAQSNSNGPN